MQELWPYCPTLEQHQEVLKKENSYFYSKFKCLILSNIITKYKNNYYIYVKVMK